MLREDIQRDIVTKKPGIYVFKSPGKRILYIGKAKNIKKRLQQYFTPSSLRKQDMVAKAGLVERYPVDNEEEALILENQMINHHKPSYNNLIKGTSLYVYIKISMHAFPKISIERYKKKDGAVYIGPKARRGDIRKFLHMTRYLFQRRTCSHIEYNKGILCSDYYFGLCKGRCAIDKGTETSVTLPTRDVALNTMHETVKLLRALFSGRTKTFMQYITDEIDHAVDKENFERAAKLRDMYNHAEYLSDKQTVVFDKNIEATYTTIMPHGNFLIWVVLTVVEGRIIDIIGFHEHKNDLTQDELLAQIEREYGIILTRNPHADQSRFTAQKKLSKKEFSLLEDNALRFLEGYTFSRFASDDPASRSVLLQQLQDDYHLPVLPDHIECVDISHFSGEQTVAGLTAMKQGVLYKSGYKRFKIKEANASDDYAALRETITRRFSLTKSSTALPQLFVIDGGVGQLNVMKTLLDNDPKRAALVKKVTFASIGKGKARSRKEKNAGAVEEFHVLQGDGSLKTYPLTYSDADKILILLRDEAHRFANQYRKKLDHKRYGK